MRLNRALPFELVGGCPGVAFQQNGLSFNAGGQEVEIVQISDGNGGQKPVGRVKVDATDDLCPTPENMPVDTTRPPDIKSLHWRQLKALVEQYGGVWTDRADALKFLSGETALQE